MLLEFTIAGTNFVLPMNAAYALALAFILVLGAGPWFIPKLHALKFGQSIREEGPQSHQVKSGTPTMGGMMIILGLTVATLVFSPWTKEVMLALFVILGHFLLGFLDDYIKVVRKHNEGLKPRQKLLGQIIIAGLVAVFGGLPTDLWVPFVGNIDFGFFFYAFMMFVMVGITNAVNLTDGLDGLASGTVAVASLFYMLVCAAMGKGELAVMLAATVVPFASETLLAGALLMGYSKWVVTLVATLGNTTGGMISYLLGWLCKWDWLEKYLRVKKEKLMKVHDRVARYGVWAALLTWLPVVGDLIAIAMGLMRVNPWWTLVLMFIGKMVRYLLATGLLSLTNWI